MSAAMVIEQPTARILGGEKPARPRPVPPPDPQSLDATRPVDIDLCPVCGGDGFLTQLRDGEYQNDACWSCGGCGERGAW